MVNSALYPEILETHNVIIDASDVKARDWSANTYAANNITMQRGCNAVEISMTAQLKNSGGAVNFTSNDLLGSGLYLALDKSNAQYLNAKQLNTHMNDVYVHFYPKSMRLNANSDAYTKELKIDDVITSSQTSWTIDNSHGDIVIFNLFINGVKKIKYTGGRVALKPMSYTNAAGVGIVYLVNISFLKV